MQLVVLCCCSAHALSVCGICLSGYLGCRRGAHRGDLCGAAHICGRAAPRGRAAAGRHRRLPGPHRRREQVRCGVQCGVCSAVLFCSVLFCSVLLCGLQRWGPERCEMASANASKQFVCCWLRVRPAAGTCGAPRCRCCRRGRTPSRGWWWTTCPRCCPCSSSRRSSTRT